MVQFSNFKLSKDDADDAPLIEKENQRISSLYRERSIDVPKSHVTHGHVTQQQKFETLRKQKASELIREAVESKFGNSNRRNSNPDQESRDFGNMTLGRGVSSGALLGGRGNESERMSHHDQISLDMKVSLHLV